VNIFEVPVYVENLKLNNKSILQYCKKLNKDDVGETVSNIGGWHSSNIKDAHIINIGVDFGILPRPGYQNKDVLLRCIKKLRCIFDPDNWSINEPIILPKIATELDKVEGVQTVKNLRVFNLFDKESGYSGNIYDIKGATREGVIYPSMDPSIFEVKNLDSDIKGRIVGY